MASFAGLRGNGNWSAGERIEDFRSMILWANPNGMSPLTALLSKVRSESLMDPDFHWFQEKLESVRVVVNYSTGYISTDNTIVIVSGGLALVPGDIIQIEKVEASVYDNELAQVSSVTSDTEIVIKRGVAGSTNAAITDADYFTKVGSAFQEGSLGPDLSTRNPSKIDNYAQIFKTAVGLTETTAHTKTRTGDSWLNDKKRKAFDHSVALEWAFLFGRPYLDTTGTHIKRYTGGLRYFVTTNSTIWTTTPTEDTFLDATYPVFNYNIGQGGDQRIVLCGNGYLNTLNKLVRDSANTQIRYDGPFKLYGMSLQRWILPQGELAIKTHPLMNLHGRYTNSAFIIDPSALKYRSLRDTKFKDNTQANDSDSREGIWLTEAGLEVNHEYVHAYHGNFTKP